jgi:hypothetical protein
VSKPFLDSNYVVLPLFRVCCIFEKDINNTGTSDAEILTPDGTTRTDTGADASINANAANASKNPSSSAPTKVPLKRVTVFIATSPPIQHQQTVVLSAAVSSTKRIPKDCKVADTLQNGWILQEVYHLTWVVKCF